MRLTFRCLLRPYSDNLHLLTGNIALSRLRDFLPVMKQANEQLALQAKLDPKSVIIDGINDEEDEEFDEGNPSEQAAEGQEKPVKQVIQMVHPQETKTHVHFRVVSCLLTLSLQFQDLMLVPDDSDDDAEKMEGQIEAEEDEEDEEFDEEGNRLPLIERQVRAAARARKPQIEVVGGQDSEESNQ